MRHPKAMEWENRLKALFDEIDARLETEYGGRYPLHPARAKDGQTANPEHSGLFNVGASFTAGFGSKIGPGYVVEVDMVTLADVPDDVVEEIENKVAVKLRERLPKAFPGVKLDVTRDGHSFKIHGTLDLGEA